MLIAQLCVMESQAVHFYILLTARNTRTAFLHVHCCKRMLTYYECYNLPLCNWDSFRLSYDETDNDLDCSDDEPQNVTLDAGQLVWALAFGSSVSHTKRNSTSLNWSSGRVVDLLLATGLQNGCIKIWHVRSRKYGHSRC